MDALSSRELIGEVLLSLGFKDILAARRVATDWRLAASRPLIAVALLSDTLLVHGCSWKAFIAYILSRIEESAAGPHLVNHSRLMHPDGVGARKLLACWENSVSVGVTDESRTARAQVAKVLSFFVEKQCTPLLIVTLRSAMRTWQDLLAQLAPDAHVGVMSSAGENAALLDSVQVPPYTTDVVIVPIEYAISTISELGERCWSDAHWKYAVLDEIGAPQCIWNAGIGGDLFGHMKETRTPIVCLSSSELRPPACTAESMLDRLELLATAGAFYLNMRHPSRGIPVRTDLLLKINKYSFGDVDLQRWACDQFLPEQLQLVLEHCWWTL